jgi:hypothetical protein
MKDERTNERERKRKRKRKREKERENRERVRKWCHDEKSVGCFPKVGQGVWFTLLLS